MRAFIGIALPSSVRNSLAALQQELARSGADVKWVQSEQLHVTLTFLGEITEAQRQAIEAMLKDVCAREQSFMLGLEGVGAFPTVAAPRVIWAGISEGREAVVRIAQAIQQQGARIPLSKGERPFAAHVTIGRVRSPRQRRELTQQLRTVGLEAMAPWRVETVTLYQSVLSSSGPTYSVLAEVPLKSRVVHSP